MADNMRAKKVEEDGTPKSKYFEPTLIASNKPTPDLKKRANATSPLRTHFEQAHFDSFERAHSGPTSNKPIPNITARGILDDYEEIDPRIRRWNSSFGVFGSAPAVVNYRQRIDALTCRDVIFCPYEAHRNTTRPLSEISFYQGFLRYLDRTVLYLPNRVMRQFGFRQPIPAMEPKYGDNLIKWKTESEMYVIVDDDRQKIIDGNSLDKGYIQWYEHHSHPRVQNIQHWSGPKLVASSIGQIDVEDLIKNTLTIKWKLKEIIESPRMSTAKMREQIQEAIDIICDLDQEEADQISEDTSPRKKKKVAEKNNKKNKQVKGEQAKTKQKKKDLKEIVKSPTNLSV